VHIRPAVGVQAGLALTLVGCSDYGFGLFGKSKGAPGESAPGGVEDTALMDTGVGDGDALSCDGTPAWDDPYGDGSLRLGDRSLGLDAGPWPFSYICVHDQGRLNICEDTTIQLGSETNTVVGGLGMRNISGGPVRVVVSIDGPTESFLLVDLTDAPMRLILDAPDSCVVVAGIGQETLEFGGTATSVEVVTEGPLDIAEEVFLLGDCGFTNLFNAGGELPEVPDCG